MLLLLQTCIDEGDAAEIPKWQEEEQDKEEKGQQQNDDGLDIDEDEVISGEQEAAFQLAAHNSRATTTRRVSLTDMLIPPDLQEGIGQANHLEQASIQSNPGDTVHREPALRRTMSRRHTNMNSAR